MFIKYKDFRINLDLIAAYRPLDRGSYKILFVTNSPKTPETDLPIISWSFDTEDQRDAMLEKLDDITYAEEITLSDDEDGTVEATVI